MPEVPRVLIAIQPRMYAEVLAFNIGQHRPDAEVSVLDPSEGLEDALIGVRPHLVVANREPGTASREIFWVVLDEPRADEEPKRLGAQISADGYSRSVQEVRTDHVLAALERAEKELV